MFFLPASPIGVKRVKQTAVYVVIQFNDPKKSELFHPLLWSGKRSRRKQKKDLGMSCCSIDSEGLVFINSSIDWRSTRRRTRLCLNLKWKFLGERKTMNSGNFSKTLKSRKYWNCSDSSFISASAICQRVLLEKPQVNHFPIPLAQ